MALPTVAIVGRPNVGKSSLFNVLCGEMISIVEPTAGVTRDRISAILGDEDRFFELVDTGGYGIVDSQQLSDHINSQISQAITTANLVLFVVDIREGLMPLDEQIADMLRKYNLNTVLVANKTDNVKFKPGAGEFAKFGLGEPICVSAANSVNLIELYERIIDELKDLPLERPEPAVMKVAVVGKRNAGKSTFVNAILGEERVIVSEVPGTTRDAVDVRFEKDGQTIVAIDTAGVRKKNKLADDIEFYSYTRATKSVKRADVVLFMIDAAVPISQVDKKLAGLISAENKPAVLVINKWDLAKETAITEDYADYLTKVMPGLMNCPLVFTTAKEAKNVDAALNLATELFKQANTKLPTAKLNKAIEILMKNRRGGSKKHGFPKVYYATQIDTAPVTILLFVNRADLFTDNFQRYIINQFRDMLPISEVPIRLVIRNRREQNKPAGRKHG